MSTVLSNSQKYLKYCKFILTIVFIISAVLLIKPSTVFAETSTNITGLNGEAEHGYGSKVGKLHWAGSTERTGFIFYFVNAKDGFILTDKDLGIKNRYEQPVVMEIIDESYKAEMLKATHYMYDFQFRSSLRNVNGDDIFIMPSTTFLKDVPPAVKYNSSTGRWSGNGVAVANWLFSVDEDGMEIWEKVLRIGLKDFTKWESQIDEAIETIKSYEKIVVVIEPIAVNAIYGTQKWGDEAKTIRLEDCDEDFYDYLNPSNYKPILEYYTEGNARIRRIEANASYMSQLVYEFTAEVGDPCPKGGANSKWTNEALPFSMTLQEDELGKSAITGKPKSLSYDEINNKSYSYGMGILSRTIKYDFISTYDGTSEKPAPSEQPVNKDGKDTTGNCTITKIYFEKEIDELSGTVTHKYVDTFTTKNTTGYINLDYESKQTGYEISGWAITKEEQDYSKYYVDGEYSELMARFSEADYHSKLGLGFKFKLDNVNNLEGHGACKHLYVVYTKTTVKTAPPVQSEDFEIPESYITKQVYFSQAANTSNTAPTASKLITNQFKWTSEAHTSCPGHASILPSCGKILHMHTAYVDSITPGCYATVLISTYECTGISSKCENEHTHDTNCYKSNYKCVACSNVYDTAISRCTRCNNTVIQSTNLICEREEHTCVSVNRLETLLTCGLDEHIHTADCFKTVYCTTTWGDNKIELGLKNTLQSNYPNILATNPKYSIIADAYQSMILRLQGSPASSTEAYKWITKERDTASTDSKSATFDYITILLRGSDEITLPEWKKDEIVEITDENGNIVETIKQAEAMKFLTGVNSVSTTKFKVGNTPQGNKATQSYTETFKAKFDNVATNLSTTLNYTKCASNTKTYTLQTTYTIPTIKVKVNVLSNTQATNSTPTTGTHSISFYPYIRMYYDTASLKNQSALVLAQTLRTISFHDGASITYTNPNAHLTLHTTQWSTHKSAKDNLLAINKNADASKILPGGSTLDLAITKENAQVVTVKTYQVILQKDSAGYKQIQATTGLTDTQLAAKVQTNKSQTLTYHKTFAQQVQSQYQNLVQYTISTDVIYRTP